MPLAPPLITNNHNKSNEKTNSNVAGQRIPNSKNNICMNNNLLYNINFLFSIYFSNTILLTYVVIIFTDIKL